MLVAVGACANDCPAIDAMPPTPSMPAAKSDIVAALLNLLYVFIFVLFLFL